MRRLCCGALLAILGSSAPCSAAAGQRAVPDSTLARAMDMFQRADSLSGSRGGSKLLPAIGLWRQAASMLDAAQRRRELAVTWTRMAIAFGLLGVRDSSIASYVRALAIQREVGDKKGEAATLDGIGEAYHYLGRPDSAMHYLSRALPLQREVGDRTGEGITLGAMGAVESAHGRIDSAVGHLFQGLAISREIGDRLGEETALNNIGALQNGVGRPDSALVYFARALPIAQEVNDRQGVASLLNNIGLAHRDLGRPDSALHYFARAYPMLREAGDRDGEAATLNNLGSLQIDLGHPDSAVEYFSRSLEVTNAGRNTGARAAALNNIGSVRSALGQPDSATVYYGRALAIVRELGDRRGEAATLMNLGAQYRLRGLADSALAYFDQALPIFRDVRDRVGEASTLMNVGLLQNVLGRPDSAAVYYTRALGLARDARNRRGEADALGDLGDLHSDLDQLDSARADFAAALVIQREIADRGGQALTLNAIGEVERKLNRPDAALDSYFRGLELAQGSGSATVSAALLNNIGLVQRSLGRPDSALAYYRRALEIVRTAGDRANEAVTLSNIGALHLSTAGPARAGAAAAAFDSAAASRALVRHRAGSDANAVSVGEGARDIFAGWSRAWLRIGREADASGNSAAGARALTASLAAAERGRGQALRDLLDRRGRSSNSSYGLIASDTTAGADLAAEARRLIAPLRLTRTALLYYLSDNDTLRVWFLSSRGELRLMPASALTADSLSDLIARARGAIGVQRDAVVPALVRLSEAVLPARLGTLLEPDVELVIVPHGALGQVPFAALTLPGSAMPLGARNAIRYAPSLHALGAAESAPVLPARRALVVGNPTMPLVRSPSGQMRQLPALSSAEEEGRWIATRLGARSLTGDAASESTVRRLLPGAGVVHLATHGRAYGTEARVRESYVALAPGSGLDGLLTLGELLDDPSLQLSADLIVLSACETGLGEARQAEGTVGLQRGLLAVGARSVLVSLWSVDDDATLALMEGFYSHWLGSPGRPKVSKAEALRQAQSDLRGNAAHPEWNRPQFWAAFQLVGAR